MVDTPGGYYQGGGAAPPPMNGMPPPTMNGMPPAPNQYQNNSVQNGLLNGVPNGPPTVLTNNGLPSNNGMPPTNGLPTGGMLPNNEMPPNTSIPPFKTQNSHLPPATSSVQSTLPPSTQFNQPSNNFNQQNPAQQQPPTQQFNNMQLNGLPQNNGFPPVNSGIPPQNSGMPPQNIGLPPRTGQMPPQNGGMPPQQNGFPPQTNGFQQHNSNLPPNGSMPPNPTPLSSMPPPNSMQNSMPPPTYQQPSGMPQALGAQGMPPQQGPPSMQQGPPGHPQQGPPGQQQQQQHNSVFDVMREKRVVQPDGWWIPEPDMSFTERIAGRKPPTERRSCIPEVMRATITACPDSSKLLKQSKLPFGLLMQPFKDVAELPIVTTHKEIIRCKSCRMYINPFVTFVDQYRWRCCLCMKMNDVPQHFFQALQQQNSGKDNLHQHPNPNQQQNIQYQNPEFRPEVNHSTIEYIAPPQYTTRAPPPVRYLYLLDVSHSALQTGYLQALCDSLIKNLDHIKSKHDKRLQIGFIAFDSHLTFFEANPERKTFKQLTVPDVGETKEDLEEDLLPASPENLLITVHDFEDTIVEFLKNLPQYFRPSFSNSGRALGPAIKAATKMLKTTGGRTSVFIGGLPTNGWGKLEARNNTNIVDDKTGKVGNMHSLTDVYKQIALECNGNQADSIQMAVDTFFIANQYCDVSTVSNVSRWSSGTIYHYQGMHAEHDPVTYDKFRRDLDRYLTRKIGFEAVLRLRCTNGIKVNQFHGNAFVRGEDILSLANVNPDAGFSAQLDVEDDLDRQPFVIFQAALLYTNSQGERRVRVHTLCLPIVKRVDEIYHNADGRACAALLAQMAVDRAMEYTIKDARTSLNFAVLDSLKTFKEQLPNSGNSLLLPQYLLPMPLYIHCLLRHSALTIASPSSLDTLDARVFAMCQIKQRPAEQSLLEIYPSLYRVDHLDQQRAVEQSTKDSEGSSGSDTSSEYEMDWETPEFLSLSAECLSADGVFLMDIGDSLLLWVGSSVPAEGMKKLFGKTFPNELKEYGQELPNIEDSVANQRLIEFIESLRNSYHRPFYAPLRIVRDDTGFRQAFIGRLLHDRIGGTTSYYDFLVKIKNDMTS